MRQRDRHAPHVHVHREDLSKELRIETSGVRTDTSVESVRAPLGGRRYEGRSADPRSPTPSQRP
jgi:hypothetical protein